MQNKEFESKDLEYEVSLSLLSRLNPELSRKLEVKNRARIAVRSADFMKPDWLDFRPSSRLSIKKAAALSCGINPKWAFAIEYPEMAEGIERGALMLAQDRLDFLIEDRRYAPGTSISLSELLKLLLAQDESAYLPAEFPGRRLSAAFSVHESSELGSRLSETLVTPDPARHAGVSNQVVQQQASRVLGSKAMRAVFGHLHGVPKQGFSDVPRWLDESHILVARREAPSEHQWNPVAFAKRLMEKKGTTYETLNHLFLHRAELKPFLPAWQKSRREQNAFGL